MKASTVGEPSTRIPADMQSSRRVHLLLLAAKTGQVEVSVENQNKAIVMISMGDCRMCRDISRSECL